MAHSSKQDSGQALVELPYVILLTCILIFVVVQPALYLYTQMALGQIAAGVCRIVATEPQNISGKRDTVIRAYVADKIESLPDARVFRIKESIDVQVVGNANSQKIEAVVSVDQVPMPLMGLLLKAGVNKPVKVSGRASTHGAHIGVEGSPQSAPQSFGFSK
ncbi:MAG: hypothetical protein FWD93_01560 [Coriobacteriia bacterium]|nr:hypothetical protein [Coriobacteriia bacterium]